MSDSPKWKWIADWSAIDGDKTYLCCAIGCSPAGKQFLARPEILRGWQVKQRMQGVYMATEWMPPELQDDRLPTA